MFRNYLKAAIRKFKPVSIVILSSIIVGSSCKGTVKEISLDQLIANIEKETPDLMNEALIPGLSLAIIQDGKIAWNGSFGVKDVETGEPVESNTVFEAASLSKPVFAFAVLTLVDQELLDLDKPLVYYIDEDSLSKYYPKSTGADERYKTITARMVLTHSTGFPNWIGQGLLSFIFDPGERFSYSGEGFSFLAIVVENITGKKLNDFIKETVFNPLEMKNSSYVWLEKYENLFASSHNFLGEKTPRSKYTDAIAGASLYTTAEDYVKFLVALINSRGLKKDTYKELLTPQIDVPARYGNNKKVCNWGLGVGLHYTDQIETCWHWGDNGDFKSYFEMSVKSKNGVVFFANGENGHAITDKLVRITTGIPGSAIATDYFIYPVYNSFVIKLFKSYKEAGIQAFEDLTEFVNDTIIKKEQYLKYAFHDLGTYLLNKGQIEESTSVFKLSEKTFPEDTRTLVYLAGISFLTGKHDEGISTLKRALDIDANLESQINSLGYRLLNANKYEEAIMVFKFNVQSFPGSANCYDSLGEAYLTKGDKKNAEIHYRKALTIDPEFPSAISALKRLEQQ